MLARFEPRVRGKQMPEGGQPGADEGVQALQARNALRRKVGGLPSALLTGVHGTTGADSR